MSKQVVLDQAVLEFHGASSLSSGITQALEEKLGKADWTELLKPVLQGIPGNSSGTGCARSARARPPAQRHTTTSAFFSYDCGSSDPGSWVRCSRVLRPASPTGTGGCCPTVAVPGL